MLEGIVHPYGDSRLVMEKQIQIYSLLLPKLGWAWTGAAYTFKDVAKRGKCKIIHFKTHILKHPITQKEEDIVQSQLILCKNT